MNLWVQLLVVATIAAMWGFSMSAAAPRLRLRLRVLPGNRPWRPRVLGVAAYRVVSAICGLIIHGSTASQASNALAWCAQEAVARPRDHHTRACGSGGRSRSGSRFSLACVVPGGGSPAADRHASLQLSGVVSRPGQALPPPQAP